MAIVVTGIGVASPIGLGERTFWAGLTMGQSGVTPARSAHFAAGVPIVAETLGDCATASGTAFRGSSSVVRNRVFELLAAAVSLAHADAALGAGPVHAARIGMVVAVGRLEHWSEDVGDIVARSRVPTEERVDRARLAELALRELHPLRRLRYLSNMGTAVVSMTYGIGGPCITLTHGDTAGLDSLIHARAMIARGAADVVLCGGSDSSVSPYLLTALRRTHHLSSITDCMKACRPFQDVHTGSVVGEGAAILVLEAAESAHRRGAPAYAELTGAQAIGPGAHRPIASSMRASRAMAGDPMVDAVVAHADGSRSDESEASAVGTINDEGVKPAVVSIGRAIGHTMRAAGAFNAATASLIVAHQRLPGAYVLGAGSDTTGTAHSPIRHVMANAVDPSGAATSVVLSMYEGQACA